MNVEVVEEFRRRVEEAVGILQRYNGEEIVAHEHPLHKAIVEIEKLCRDRRRDDREITQLYSLPIPINSLWFMLLDVSRTGKCRHFHFYQNWIVSLPESKLDKLNMLSMMLASALKGCANMLELYVKADGNLPYAAKTTNN